MGTVAPVQLTHIDNILYLIGEPMGDMPAAGLYGKELVPMVTYSDLIQFVIMLCAIITLVIYLQDKHKK